MAFIVNEWSTIVTMQHVITEVSVVHYFVLINVNVLVIVSMANIVNLLPRKFKSIESSHNPSDTSQFLF